MEIIPNGCMKGTQTNDFKTLDQSTPNNPNRKAFCAHSGQNIHSGKAIENRKIIVQKYKRYVNSQKQFNIREKCDT